VSSPLSGLLRNLLYATGIYRSHLVAIEAARLRAQ
jgi:hypothetical protein